MDMRELGISGGSVAGGVLLPELLQQFADGPVEDWYSATYGGPIPVYVKPSCIVPLVGGALSFLPLIPAIGGKVGDEVQMASVLFGTAMLVEGVINTAKELALASPPAAAMITGGKPYEQRVGAPRTYMDVI